MPKSAVLVAADGSYVTPSMAPSTRTRIKARPAHRFVEIEDRLYAGDWVAVKGVRIWLVELSASKAAPCYPPPKNAQK